MDVDAEGGPRLLIFVSTGATNQGRRRSLRRSWFQYVRAADSPLPENARARVELVFVAARGGPQLQQEAEEEGDIVLVDAPEGYENLWRKALVFLLNLVNAGRGDGPRALHYVMHADDDSFVRLDLLMPLLADFPRRRFYWGYIWDGTGNRKTAPIRNTRNKSHMPESQYPLDYYPSFASGCGFILSWDLVIELTKQPLPDYRLLDPPFGIHLCGPASDGYLVLEQPVVPVHDERVRPYRAIPIFHPSTIVQHYLTAEEMRPFYCQALQAVASSAAVTSSSAAPATATARGPEGVPEELLASTLNGADGADASTEGAGSGGDASGATGLGAGGGGGVGAASGEKSGDNLGAPEQLYAMLVDMGLLRR